MPFLIMSNSQCLNSKQGNYTEGNRVRDDGGRKKANRHFHVRLMKGNEEGHEDEKKKSMTKDGINIFRIQ